MVKQLLTLILAAQAGDGGCAPLPKACDLSFEGLTVQDGRVVDTVTVSCKPRPVEHVLQARVEYKPFDTWDAYDRTLTTPDLPGNGTDQGGKVLRVTVSSPCLEGAYRTWVHAEGRGPVDVNNPQPIPFEFEDTGWQKFISAEDCAGGD